VSAPDPRLGEIEARLAAARQGPWLVNDEEQTVRVEDEDGKWFGEIMYDRSAEHPTYWVSEFRPDAEFIANAPADVAYLLAELRKRDAALEAATRLIGELTEHDECSFDHHGGCQAHGYLALSPGSKCPQQDAKDWNIRAALEATK